LSRTLIDASSTKAVAPNGLDCATLQAESCGVDSGGVTSAMRVEFDPARRDLDIGIGCSEMGLKVRWSFMALLAVAIVALPGCAATGPLAGDPCWGFFVCTGWH
jgi:hypothetical protein